MPERPADPAPDRERWRALDRLFAESLLRPPAERTAYLRQATGDDPGLYGEVCTLLERSVEAARVLGESAAELAGPLLLTLGTEPDAADHRCMQGQQVGPYRIQEEIGRGGMGVVYRATDVRLDRPVALKFLPPYLSGDPSAKRRLMAEARAASATEHPNVATLHEIGETDDGQLYLVLAYYEGETLKERIARGPIPADEAVGIGLQIAAGLAAAHGNGVVHRDIKPGNILVTRDGWVKLLDFGIATTAGGDSSAPGGRLGTVRYMSPEHTRDESVGVPTDLWAVGVVLFEMLTGRRPFDGPDDATVIHAIRHDEPVGLRPDAAGIPDRLKPILARALARDPADRYQTAAELIRDLGRGTGPPAAAARARWARGAPIGAALLLLAAILIGAWVITAAAAPEPRVSPVAIAVLPFAHFGGDPGGTYFSDGITEDILDALAGVADLAVISRTSAMHYKGTTKRLSEIADELGVAHIVEGSVRRDGDRVRISARLVDARTEEQLWSETYERDLTDIFQIQSDIARRVASALEARLSPTEIRRLEIQPTDNLAAYDLYLQGHDYLQRFRREDTEVAVALFRRAIEVDPRFALAHARLGAAFAFKVFQYGDPHEWADSALASARHSVALDPDLAEGHLGLGLAHLAVERYDSALAGFERAVELRPNYPGAMTNIGVVKWRLGAYDEALPWYRSALALNPVDEANPLSTIGGVYALLGLFDQAGSAVDRALTIQPDLPLAYHNAILLHLVQDNDEEAREHARMLVATSPGNARAWATAGTVLQFGGDLPSARSHFERAHEISATGFDLLWRSTRVLLAHTLWHAGEREAATVLLDQFLGFAGDQIDRGNAGPFIPYNLAAVHAIRGNRAEAVSWLREAVRQGRKEYLFLSRDPLFEQIRDEPAFRQIIAANRAEIERQRARVVGEGW
jgi:eukaryotic-like serine/threonine-protein kinase